MRKLLVVAAVLALGTGACAEQSPTVEGPEDSPAPEETVTISATEYAFQAPDEIPSGLVEITMENKGAETHQAVLFQLKDGQTADTFTASVESDPTAFGTLELGTYAGGPNAVAPEGTSTSIQGLAPGNFLFVCFVPSPSDGKAHITKGMVTAVEVTDTATEAEPPEAEKTITTKEYEFGIPEGIETGEATIAVRNEGEDVHEVGLLKVAAGSTADDVRAFFSAPPGTTSGPPPATDAGGLGPIPPGDQGWFTATLEPGTYALICFIPDEEEGHPPHVALGMFGSFTVGGEAEASPGP
jgi:hypothetical protein